MFLSELLASLDVIPEEDQNALIVIKSHRLMGGQSKLTLNERKLFDLCVAKINRKNPARDAAGFLYIKMDYDEIAKILLLSERVVKRFIKKAPDAFLNKPIVILPEEEGAEPIYMPIAIQCSASDEIFKIRFHPMIERDLMIF